MLEFNIYTFLLIPLIILISFVIYSRLQKPLEYRQLSSIMPSLTKSIWSEITVSIDLAMKHPKGKKLIYFIQ